MPFPFSISHVQWCYNCGQSKWGADLNWPKCQVCGEQFIDHGYAMRQMCYVLILIIVGIPVWLPLVLATMIISMKVERRFFVFVFVFSLFVYVCFFVCLCFIREISI
jgi:hypothetical protein